MATKATRYFWRCEVCGAQNSREDSECQFCECGGPTCGRGSCSDWRHFLGENLSEVWADIALGYVETANTALRNLGCEPKPVGA